MKSKVHSSKEHRVATREVRKILMSKGIKTREPDRKNPLEQGLDFIQESDGINYGALVALSTMDSQTGNIIVDLFQDINKCTTGRLYDFYDGLMFYFYMPRAKMLHVFHAGDIVKALKSISVDWESILTRTKRLNYVLSNIGTLRAQIKLESGMSADIGKCGSEKGINVIIPIEWLMSKGSLIKSIQL